VPSLFPVFKYQRTTSEEGNEKQFRKSKKVQGVTEGTLYEIALSLRNSERLVGKCSSKQITQNIIDKFILQRGSEVKRPTLNKDIRNTSFELPLLKIIFCFFFFGKLCQKLF
jgi:hypothetical protein